MCVCVCVSRHVQMYVPLISASVFWNTAVEIAVPSGLEGKKGEEERVRHDLPKTLK